MSNIDNQQALIDALHATREHVTLFTRKTIDINSSYRLDMWSVKKNAETNYDERSCVCLYRRLEPSQDNVFASIEESPCAVFTFSGYGGDYEAVLEKAMMEMNK